MNEEEKQALIWFICRLAESKAIFHMDNVYTSDSRKKLVFRNLDDPITTHPAPSTANFCQLCKIALAASQDLRNNYRIVHSVDHEGTRHLEV